MNISKRAEQKLLGRVPENHVVRYRHYRYPNYYRYELPKKGPISKTYAPYKATRDIPKPVSDGAGGEIGGVFPKGGRTICTIFQENHVPETNDVERIAVARGEALCSFSDQFCRRTGRTIALGRALAMLEE